MNPEINVDTASPVAPCPTLSDADRHRVLVQWNQTERAYPRDKCIHQLFEEQVEKTPDAVAVVCEDQALTYRELNGRANRIAHHLHSLEITPDSTVGVCLRRSTDMIASLLGILKAGGAYVALDPDYPKDRLSFMLSDSKAQIVVTQECLATHFTNCTSTTLVFLEAASQLVENRNLPPISSPSKLAYVIYTSGSTGTPKGVAIEHRNTVSFLHWVREAFTKEELSGVLASTSICFDLSVFEIFGPLSWGGTIVLAHSAIDRDIGTHWNRVQLINTVPSVMKVLLETQPPPPSKVTVNLAGEPLKPALVDALHSQWKIRRVNDLYGPSETTTYSTWCTRQPKGPSTIGRPIANTQIYLLDDHLIPILPGEVGELFIGGAGLARGYLHRPEMTAERFVHVEINDSPQRLYRTGDLGRWNADGTLVYLGRRDHQVKIRGFRIELGEIETALECHPKVTACAVVAQSGRDYESQLAAFIVTCNTISMKELREWLARKLPNHLIPTKTVLLKTLPLTPNGKIDRTTLEHWDDQTGGNRPQYVAPRNNLEQQLCNIWQQSLKHTPVSIEDNFFDLGGHSLLALKIISAIRSQLSYDVPQRWLFDFPTIKCLALKVESAAELTTSTTRISAANRLERLPMSFGQQRFWVLQQILPDPSAYHVPLAYRIQGPLNEARLHACLLILQQRHEILRTELVQHDEDLLQRVQPDSQVQLNWEVQQWQHLTATEVEERLVLEARRPFALERAPLWRVLLAQLDTQDFIFSLTFQHSVVDEWALRVFIDELERLYAANGDPVRAGLQPLSVQYADYATWQKQELTGQLLERQREYWGDQVKHFPSALQLPADKTPTDQRTSQGGVHRFQLPQTLAANIRQLVRLEKTSLFCFALSAFQIWLHRVTEQNDVVVGIPVILRNRPELQPLVGFFQNTLPIRLHLDRTQSFRDVHAMVRQKVLDGIENADLPFEQITQLAVGRRDGNQTPVYQVMFVLVEEDVRSWKVDSLTAHKIDLHNNTSKNDLLLSITAEGDKWLCELEYSTDLFTPNNAENMASQWVELLQLVPSHLDEPIGCLDPKPLPVKQQAQDNGPLAKTDFTPNGKIDHEALAQLTPQPVDTGTEYVPPRTSREHQLVEIWIQLLQHDRIGIHDNFFDLGGHSLLAVQMVGRIHRQTGVMLPLSRLFENPTIHHLAIAIAEENLLTPAIDVGSKTNGTTAPTVFLLGWYLDKDYLGLKDQRTYVLPFPDFGGLEQQCSVEYLADVCLKTLHKIQPHGPVILVGYSLAGIVAYEMACRLKATNEEPALVAVIDTAPASWDYRMSTSLTRFLGKICRLKFSTQLLIARSGYYLLERLEQSRQHGLRHTWRAISADTRRAKNRWLLKWASRNGRTEQPAPKKSGDSVALDRMQLPFGKFWAHRWAHSLYSPQRYDGNVTLFVSDELRAERREPGRGWKKWAGRLREYPVPGTHSSCITAYKNELAQQFRECLDTLELADSAAMVNNETDPPAA